MHVNDRMRANAIVEELTEFSTAFFNAAAARELIALIPVKKHNGITIIFSTSSKNDRGSAYSPGVGNIPLGEEDTKRDITINEQKKWRVGGYKVSHTPGCVEIREFWADTKEMENRRACMLIYNKKTGEPKQIRALMGKNYFGLISIGIFRHGSYPATTRDEIRAVCSMTLPRGFCHYRYLLGLCFAYMAIVVAVSFYVGVDAKRFAILVAFFAIMPIFYIPVLMAVCFAGAMRECFVAKNFSGILRKGEQHWSEFMQSGQAKNSRGATSPSRASYLLLHHQIPVPHSRPVPDGRDFCRLGFNDYGAYPHKYLIGWISQWNLGVALSSKSMSSGSCLCSARIFTVCSSIATIRAANSISGPSRCVGFCRAR